MISSDRSGSRLPVGSSARRSDRVVDQRARDRDALLLAAGEIQRIGVHPVLQAHPLQHLEGTPPLLRGRHAEHFGTKEMFSSTVRVGISLKSWKMKPMPRRYSWISLRFSVARLWPLTNELALAGALLHQQQAQERRLAGAARAGEEDELALVDGERAGPAARTGRDCRASRDGASRSRCLCTRGQWPSGLRGLGQFRQHAEPDRNIASALACLELAFQQLVGELRVGLAAALLHHLADEEPERLRACRRDTAPPRPRWRPSRRGRSRARRLRPSSAPAPRLRRSRRRDRPESYILANTSLAMELLMVPLSTSAIRPASAAGGQRRVADRRAALVQRAQQSRPSPSCWPPSGSRRRRLPPRSSRRAPRTASARRRRNREWRSCATNRAPARLRQLGHRRAHARRRAPRPRPAAAGRARESSGSRAPLPCCAWNACGRSTESHSRVSWTHAAAAVQQLDLPVDLVLDRLLQVAEGVDVLHLRLGAERLLPTRAHRDVGVAAQAALFHVAVVDAEPHQDVAQAREELGRLGGRAHVGLRHDLDERHAAAVVVDVGRRSESRKPSCSDLPASSSMWMRVSRTQRRPLRRR